MIATLLRIADRNYYHTGGRLIIFKSNSNAANIGEIPSLISIV